MKKGTYVNFNGKQVEYSYESELTLSQKANFVMEVAGMVVSSTIGYAYVLKEAIFNYCLIKYFTDIVLFKTDEEFNLDMIDKFCHDNKETVLDVITKEMGKEQLDELILACDEAIEFRKVHFSDYRDEIADLLQVVREFVVKPDYMNELLSALTDVVNKFSENDTLDMSAVNKLVDIIPIMKDMGSKEVAKAIIEDNKKDTAAEQKTQTKSKARKTKNEGNTNLEVVK